MAFSITNVGTASETTNATTLTLNGTVPAGSLIVAIGTEDDTTTTGGTFKDAVNGNYTGPVASGNTNNSSANSWTGLFYFPNCAALSSTTITYTMAAASGNASMTVCYITGAASSSPLDSAVTATAFGTGNSPSVTSGTPGATDMLVAWTAVHATRTFTQDTADGWAAPPNAVPGGGGLPALIGGGSQVSGSSKKFAPTWSSTGGPWWAAVVGFKPPSVATFVPSRTFDPSVLAWQPDPFYVGGQAYQPRLMSPGIPGMDVRPPPFQHPERTIAINAATIAAWQPDPWPQTFVGGQQAYGRGLLNPSVTAAMVNNPPFGIPLPAQPIWLDQWKSDPWPPLFIGGSQPYAPHPNSPGIPGIDVEAPPAQHFERGAISVTIKQAWQPDLWPTTITGGRQPYDQSRLSPSITAVPVNNPPLGHPERWLVVAQIKAAQAWQPDPWPTVFLGAEQPYAPEVANPAALNIAVSNPPLVGGAANHLATLIRAWQPDPWPAEFVGGKQPYDQARLPPAISAVAVNSPPFGISSSPPYLLVTWQLDSSLPVGSGAYQPQKLVPGQTTDNPPFRNQERAELSIAIKQAWQPDIWPFSFAGGWQPYTPRTLSPGVPGQSHDQPPPQMRDQGELASSIKVQWRDTPWPYVFIGDSQPYEAHFPPIASVAVVVNNPPFQNRGRTPEQAAAITAQWQPDPWPPISFGGGQAYAPKLLTPPSVDRPFALHPERSAVTASIKVQWQPDPWPFVLFGAAQPYSLRQVGPGIPGRSADPPPFQTQGKRPINIAITLAPWQPDPWPFDFLGGPQPYQQGALSPGIARALASSGLGPPVGQFVLYFLSSAPGQLYPAYITAFDRSTSAATVTYFPPGNQPLPVISVFYDPLRQTPSSWSYQDPQDRFNDTVPSVGQVVRFYDGTSAYPGIITAIGSDGNISLTAFAPGASPTVFTEVNYDYTGTNPVSWRYAEIQSDFVETDGPRLGQIVAFISGIGVGYPAMITGINTDGTVSLMGFAPGANQPIGSVAYSAQDTVPSRWKYAARRQ